MNLDDHISGLFDPNSPINRKEEFEQDDRTLEEFINDKNTLGAILRLEEVRFEVQKLRDYANYQENYYLLRRLHSIYNKL